MRALKWPIISWVLLDALFLLLSGVKGVDEMFTSPVAAMLSLAFGIWVGYKIVEFKGAYLDAIFSGVIIGAVCFLLCIVGYGMVLGLGIAGSLPIATFMFGMNLAGAVVGGGFALTK